MNIRTIVTTFLLCHAAALVAADSAPQRPNILVFRSSTEDGTPVRSWRDFKTSK